MEKVSESAVLLDARVRRGKATVVYLVHECWEVEVSAHVKVPWDGPESVAVHFRTDPGSADADVAEAAATSGVTTDILRAIPLVDARKRLRWLRAQSRAKRDARPSLPARLETDLHWATFARLYADAAAAGVRQPLIHLSAQLNLGRNTVAARVKRVRELGYLTRPSEESMGELTPLALSVLKGTSKDG